MPSVRQEKKRIVHRLCAAGVEAHEAACQATVIVEHVTGDNSARQILLAEQQLSDQSIERIEAILEQRDRRVPLQYCLGYGWFMGAKFYLKPGVFIPRTDTETLVVAAAELLELFDGENPERAGDWLLGEVGIGGGAIAISLLKAKAALRIVACDVNVLALQVSAENARLYGVEDRLHLSQGDWRQVLPHALDAIISNPPYIPLAQKADLDAEVRDYEPEVALFGSDIDGLGFYRAIALTGKSFLRNGRGFVAVETGDGQSDAVLELFAASGWENLQVHCDVNGLPRVVSARCQ